MRMTRIKALLAIAFLVGGSTTSLADMSIEGLYQGKNIFVQSPESEDGFGFCISRVSVNGNAMTSTVQTSAFQVDFAELGVKVGDPVFVVFETSGDCQPKVLNPEVLLPKSTFVINDISCTVDGSLTWSTTGESGKLTYQVEQYRWNKWIVVGEVDGLGSNNSNNYKFDLTPHSGENKIRVSQTDNSGKKHVSKEVVFTNDAIKTPELKITENKITFVSEGKAIKSKYEIFDAYGNIVKKGYNSEVDISQLKVGAYHINYDNQSERFVKK